MNKANMRGESPSYQRATMVQVEQNLLNLKLDGLEEIAKLCELNGRTRDADLIRDQMQALNSGRVPGWIPYEALYAR